MPPHIKSAAILLMLTSSICQAGSLSSDDVEAICRTALAEAKIDGDVGIAGVVATIKNRLASRQFGDSIQAVINQRDAFTPVTRAGGWERLPPCSATDYAKISYGLSLDAAGALRDVSAGATFFQNREIVSAENPKRLDFNGMPQVAVIGHHTFYSPTSTLPQAPAKPDHVRLQTSRSLFVGEEESLREETEDSQTVLVPDKVNPK